MILSPLVKQAFLDNNGSPLVSGRVFTYAAGTSTKLATYRDSAGTLNSNPIVLDYRGEADIWLDPNLTYKFILAPPGSDDPPTRPIWTVDNISSGFLASLALVPPWAKTATEIAASANPVAYTFFPKPEDVRRYGANDEDATDDTATIQATINSQNAGTIAGGSIWLPGDANSNYNISNSLTLPKRTAGDNFSKWYALRGMGRGAPRVNAVTGLANKVMVDASGTAVGTPSYYREISDLYLNGAGIAQGGLDLSFVQHFRVDNVFITGMEDGSGTGFGIKTYGAICTEFLGYKLHNLEGNGFNAYTDSGNFNNANLYAGGSVLDVTKSGGHFATFAGCALIGDTSEFCDEYGYRFSGYSGTTGFVGGGYTESNGLGDFYIGDETQANALSLDGRYMNGYSAGVSATNYTPIWIKFADGVKISCCMVAQTTRSATGFLLVDANIAGGNVSNVAIEDCQVRGLSTSTAPNAIANLAQTWPDFGNRILHPTFFPLIMSNLIKRGWPSAGWTVSVSGTGTATMSGNNTRPLMGGGSCRIIRPAASTASVSQTFALETGSPYKGRFVTLAIPLRDNAGSSQLVIAVVPDGTSPQTVSYNISALSANQERLVYALCYVPSNATQIAVNFTANSTGADVDVGMPCLYVGAAQWYSSYAEGDTFGTWTPVIGGSGGTSGQTYASQVGYWSRNGHLVTCSYDVTLSNKGTITTNVVITGLPFVGVTTGTAGLQYHGIGFFSNMGTNWISLFGYVEGQNSRAYVLGLAAAAATPTFLATADIANNTRLAGSFTYAVNQP